MPPWFFSRLWLAAREREEEGGRMFHQRLSYEIVDDGDAAAHPGTSHSVR